MIRLPNFIQNLIRKFWKELLVLALFLILTLVLLYPFSVLKMDVQLIGDGGDGYQNLWNLWWVKRSLFSGSNAFLTNLLFYPNGADLYVHSLSPAAGLMTIPFQLSFGLVFSYNLIVVLSFVLGGYGAYRLAFHVTKDRKASFFAGLVFTFSAYHFARALEHLNLVSIQWLPFYVLFLLKMRQEKSLRNVVFAVAFLVLTALMADLQYVLFLGIFTLFYTLYELAVNREQIGRFLVRLGIMTAMFTGLTFLFLSPLIIGSFTGKYAYAASSPSDSILLSSDLLGFFTPSSSNFFFGRYAEGILSRFSSAKLWPMEITYIGYTCAALAVLAAVKLRKTATFWLLSSLAFMILSLGPILHVLGSSVFTPFRVNIPLPELFLYYVVPIFRAPSRFVVMVMLGMAVLSAISLKYATARIGSLRRGKVLGWLFFILLCIALLAECNMSPYPVVEDTSIPKFYYQLARMNGTFSVLDLPQTYMANNLYMYYDTVSEKPLLGGSISRIPLESLQPLLTIPIVKQTGYVLNGNGLMEPTEIILQDLNLTNLNAFQLFNVRYVILHKNLMDSSTVGNLTRYLNSLIGPPVYTDGTITAYETKPDSQQDVFAYLSDGWWDLEALNGTPTRWMESNATIKVISPTSQYYTVNFTVGTEVANKTLTVFANGKLLGYLPVHTVEPYRYLMRAFLKEGVNELTFHSEPSFVPADVVPNSIDTRPLTVFIQNVEISPD